jgi:hypothetical protein
MEQNCCQRRNVLNLSGSWIYGILYKPLNSWMSATSFSSILSVYTFQNEIIWVQWGNGKAMGGSVHGLRQDTSQIRLNSHGPHLTFRHTATENRKGEQTNKQTNSAAWVRERTTPTEQITLKKKTPWSESASELFRPSDRRLSAKWLLTFADRGCHVVSVTNPYGRILDFLDRSRYFSIK